MAMLTLAQAAVAKLEGSVIEIRQKAGVDGRLFGSVTNADIAQAVGQSIQKAQVRLPEGPLKTVGDHAVQLVVHTDAVATITIRVVGEAV
jgi:large subunit ribosomal protein L9